MSFQFTQPPGHDQTHHPHGLAPFIHITIHKPIINLPHCVLCVCFWLFVMIPLSVSHYSSIVPENSYTDFGLLGSFASKDMLWPMYESRLDDKPASTWLALLLFFRPYRCNIPNGLLLFEKVFIDRVEICFLRSCLWRSSPTTSGRSGIDDLWKPSSFKLFAKSRNPADGLVLSSLCIIMLSTPLHALCRPSTDDP